MKKVVSSLLVFVSAVCMTFAFAGCGDKPAEENNSSTENKTAEYVSPLLASPLFAPTLEGRGNFYTMEVAYDNGWLNADDVRSLACCYYELYTDEENPYSGAYKEPTEKLSEETESELKQAFAGGTNNVTVDKYYGTYNDNIVVTMRNHDIFIDILIEPEFNIGGIIFKNFWQGQMLVYHLKEKKPSIEVKGQFYDLKQAYDNGWLDISDLKSIACRYYDVFNRENPYDGLYVAPEKLSEQLESEVKQAYLEQVAHYPQGMPYDVRIHNYFGIYRGNVVVGISSRYVGESSPEFRPTNYYIGGIEFEHLRRVDIRVYHI